MSNKINLKSSLKEKPKENNITNKKLYFILPLKEKPKENNIYFLIKLPPRIPVLDQLKKELNHFPDLNKTTSKICIRLDNIHKKC